MFKFKIRTLYSLINLKNKKKMCLKLTKTIEQTMLRT